MIQGRYDIFEKRGDAACDVGMAAGGFGDAREELQKRRLAGTVPSDQPDRVALLDLERQVLHRPDVARPRGASNPARETLQTRLDLSEPVALA